MERLFAVIQTHGAGFKPVPLEQQEDWRAHADFMNALEAEGVVLMGGPLEGTRMPTTSACAWRPIPGWLRICCA
jgi:hypothetical protein